MFMKKLIAPMLIIYLLISMVGCGGVPTTPPNISSELVLVQVTDPKSNIIFVAGKKNEEAMAVLGEKDIEGKPTGITGAVYVLEQGDSFAIEVGIEGLPIYLIDSEDNKLIFENYTNSTADISIYDSNGNLIQGPITTNIDSEDLLELKQLYYSFYSKGLRWSTGNTADALKWGATALSVTGCVLSLYGTVQTGGALALTPAVGWACGSATLSVIAAVTPTDIDNVISMTIGAGSCLISGGGCASTILNVVNLGIEAAEDNDTEIPEPTEAIFQWGNLVLGGTSCHLVWKDNSDNEVGFRIERRLYPPPFQLPDPDVHHVDFRLVIVVGPDVQTYTDIVPLAAIPEYRIAAIAADGRLSEWTTFSVVVMEKPTELQAEVSGSPLHVKLSWKDNSRNELGFRIYRWTGIGDEGPWLEQSDTEWPLLGTVGTNGETFTDVEVKSGYTHRYFVVAFNDDESSLPSNVETVFIPIQQPTADFTFKLSGLTVNFTDTSTDPDNNIVSWYWDFSDDKTSDTQNPIHTYLKAGTYDVILMVTDAAGFTSTKTQTITVCTAPGSLTLNATPECDGTTSQIRLNWTNSSGATSYDAYRNNALYYSGLIGTQFINSGNIKTGTSYSYYIIAKNSCGSTASNIVSATAISCGSVITPSLSFTGLTPSQISTSTSPYQATLSASGSNFNNVNRVSFSWSGAASGSKIWNKGDTNWNAAVTVNSDLSMTLQPRVVETNPTWSGTVYWTVTLRDNTSATASRSFTVTYTPTTISATINTYSPNSKITVNTGQLFTISTNFTNTGNTAAYFYAGASIWDSSGNVIFNDWGGKTYLSKGQQGSASWSHTINTPGEYWLQFGVWDEAKSELLDKEPSPSQNLIKVLEPTTISATINTYSPNSKITVNTGQLFTISTNFTNTGNTAAYFYAGASIWDSSGNVIFNDWGGKTYLSKGQQGSASWSHTINTPGEYWLQFGVWDEAKSELLDKEPSPSQNLIKVDSITQLAPQVIGVDPSQPTANPLRQYITILGDNFVGGAQVTLQIISSVYPIPEDRTQFIDSTRIKVYVGLTDSGNWKVWITNPDGQKSNEYSFYVKP